LRAQHLTGLKLIEQISNGKLNGAEIGSKEITLVPQNIISGRFIGDTHTAGSVCLLMQSCVPCALFADNNIKLDLRGGTNADNAPQIDYYEHVFHPIVEKFGVSFETQILRRGYYPKGGGELHVTIKPSIELQPIQLLHFGGLKKISGKAFVAGYLPIKIAETMATTAKKLLSKEFKDIEIEIEAIKEPDGLTIGVGTGIM
jgi:RNA 3'-terminal phosphate cyclase (ATP)